MMTEAVLGKEISQIQELAEIFSQMVRGQEDPRQKELGDASLPRRCCQIPPTHQMCHITVECPEESTVTSFQC